MPLPTSYISNGLRLSVAGTEYQCDITGYEEVVSTYGGDEKQTACGVIRTPLRSTVTGVKVTMVENVAATGLFMYLRDNVSAGSEAIIYGGSNTLVESATNPEWGAVCSGWTIPGVKTQVTGGFPTSECEFSFVGPPVKDVT